MSIRRLAIVSLMVACLVALSGAGRTMSAPRSQPGAASSLSLACTSGPAGPFGMCLHGRPHFSCCSAAALGWSDIFAGSTVDIRGFMYLKRKGSSAVLITGPEGFRTVIQVATDGAFSQRVPFRTAGTYRIGVLSHGHRPRLQTFDVAWRYRVLKGPTFAEVFRAPGDSWPRSDNVYLAAPASRKTTWMIVLENARGVPQPRAALGPKGTFANRAGIVKVTFSAPNFPGGAPQVLAAGLFAQTYSDIRQQGTTLAGLPGADGFLGVPRSIASVARAGRRYFSLEDVLAHLGLGAEGLSGVMGDFRYDPATHYLSIADVLRGTEARVSSVTGEVEVLSTSASLGASTWKSYATVHPVFAGGQIYLSLHDMTIVSGAIAWAAPDGHGGMLFCNPWLP